MNISVVSLLAIIITGVTLIANHIILSHRMTFDSVEEMQDYVNGTWVYELSRPDDKYILSFSEHLVEDVYTDWPTLCSADEITYHPKRGYIDDGYTKYIVTNEGNITDGTLEYTKSYAYSFTPFIDSFRILDTKLLSNTDNKYVEGTIEHIGDRKFSHVEIKCDFKNSEGDIVDSVTSFVPYYDNADYKSDNLVLEPGNSYYFRISTNSMEATDGTLYLVSYSSVEE